MREFSALLTVLWLFIAMPTHAQQSPMVQCRIGSFVQVVPDFACDAFMRGATKLRPAAHPSDGGDYTGIKRCAAEVAQKSNNQPYEFIHVCSLMWQAMARDRAVAKTCPRCAPP
jgi:hypothetical protein